MANTTGDPLSYASPRACFCVGYLNSPGGRCCMDRPYLPQVQTITTDRITVRHNDLPIIYQGWQCPLCKTVHSPSVGSCDCQRVTP